MIEDDDFWDAFRAPDETEALRRLIASGARLRHIDPLMWAVSEGRIDLVDLMLSSNPELLNAFDTDLAWTPLMQAADVGDVKMARHLIERDAEVDARDECAYNEKPCLRPSAKVTTTLLASSSSTVRTRPSKAAWA